MMLVLMKLILLLPRTMIPATEYARNQQEPQLIPANFCVFQCLSARNIPENIRKMEAVFRSGEHRTGSFHFRTNPLSGIILEG